jgi:ATP-dependent DNA ligase
MAGLIETCLPSPAKAPPAGPDWLHEIKHYGFRILARRDTNAVRLYTDNGNDFTKRFPLGRGGGRDTAGALVPDRRIEARASPL